MPLLLDPDRELTNADPIFNQGFFALSRNDRAPKLFMLHWYQMNIAETQSHATGTGLDGISKRNFRPNSVVPSAKMLIATSATKIAPLHAQITANLHQSRTFSTLRETLLPKLLSEELKIENFHKSLQTN